MLLAAGADPRMSTKAGETAKEFALQRGNTDIAELLDAAGKARSKK